MGRSLPLDLQVVKMSSLSKRSCSFLESLLVKTLKKVHSCTPGFYPFTYLIRIGLPEEMWPPGHAVSIWELCWSQPQSCKGKRWNLAYFATYGHADMCPQKYESCSHWCYGWIWNWLLDWTVWNLGWGRYALADLESKSIPINSMVQIVISMEFSLLTPVPV